ncbi:lysophospholipid acyltransferase family protein [Desulfotomaculum copahuensis]|uniref:1-acyl-sn-glycerol-3-phosphate acyltransferase n=1 Tax=Desulfotomaculum copahuensis TaxID=1838280 RepID=A0A1B7LIN4_9FIRM|nr:lysophospholipid acyltransferase family protein [Desulfotomaculum copahuensis]OAT86413.1 acyl-phosphate glycerol 3-phosphate acyltransferase [Desulfotomaculum copahuensis]
MFYRLARVLCRLILLVLRRWTVCGAENLPRTGGVLVISNHQSYWDPVVVGCALDRQVHFMAKGQLFRIPVLGPVIRALGAFPVERGGGDRPAVRTSLQILARGLVLGIFPEGTRSRSGGLIEPHLGAAMLALRAKVPVLPVAVINTRGIWGKVTVHIGKPLEFPAFYGRRHTREDYRTVSRMLMGEIASLMDSAQER